MMERDELVRIFDVLLYDAREQHRTLVGKAEVVPSHTALYEDESQYGPDEPCLTCGHINEAEYALSTM